MNMRQFYRAFEKAVKNLSLVRLLEDCEDCIRLKDESSFEYCPITAVCADKMKICKSTSSAIYAGEYLLDIPGYIRDIILNAADKNLKHMTLAEKRCQAALLRRINQATFPCLQKEPSP
jgi:hypothetical protein